MVKFLDKSLRNFFDEFMTKNLDEISESINGGIPPYSSNPVEISKEIDYNILRNPPKNLWNRCWVIVINS